jgi:hypothetical protein
MMTMKPTLNTFSNKSLAFMILAASLSLPAIANAVDVSAGAELSAGVTTPTIKHTVTKHVRSVKHKIVSAKNGAAKVVSSASTAATTTVDDAIASTPSTSVSGSINGNATTSSSTTTHETTTTTPSATVDLGTSAHVGGIGASVGTSTGITLP